MPSPIPNPIYADVNKPGDTTQLGCVQCLSEGLHAPLEIAYHYGGYSMCMTHAQKSLAAAQQT